MAFIEEGRGRPVLFIHGGIGSAVMWRRQIAHISQNARCIALDLIGTGESDRLLPSSRESYQPEVHLSYVESFLEVLDIHEPLILVLHGWASMIGFSFAQRHAGRVAGICHMESITQPLDGADLDPMLLETFERSRGPDGERFVRDTDEYFDLAVKRQFVHPPGRIVVEEFRRTLGAGNLRQALHTGLNSVPIDKEPASTHAFVETYAQWLRQSDIPKLLILGEPGYLLVGKLALEAEALPNQTVVRVQGAHLLPEDSPDGVGLLLARWIDSL